MPFILKNAILIALIASLGTLATVFVAQYGFGLKPCVLCVYQRWPYAAIIALAILAYFLRGKIADVYFKGAIALSFAVTAGIGAFHVGVEKGWWEGSAECTADTSNAVSLADLKAQILSAPLIKCDEVAWELFGISMAGYNFLFASGMVLLMLLSIVMTSEKRV